MIHVQPAFHTEQRGPTQIRARDRRLLIADFRPSGRHRLSMIWRVPRFSDHGELPLLRYAHPDTSRLRDQDQLTLRVLCRPEAEPSGALWTDPLQPAEYWERLDRARDLTDRSDEMFRVDGVTVSPYGPCWPGFTLMREPYRAPYGRQTQDRSSVSLEKAGQAIRYCHEKGVRLSIITSGLAEMDSTSTNSKRSAKHP